VTPQQPHRSLQSLIENNYAGTR